MQMAEVHFFVDNPLKKVKNATEILEKCLVVLI